MRNPSVAFGTALTDAPTKGIVPRRFISIAALDRATYLPVAEPYSFWTGDEDLSFTVVDGQTGVAVIRTYVGLGSTLVIPTIPRVSKLEIQTIAVKFPSTYPLVNAMVREDTVHFAKVDIHEGLLSTVSRRLVANPEVAFLGECDRDPINTPSAGGTGTITLEIVSDAIRGLSQPNPAKRSYQYQLQNAGDEFGKYGNAFENIQITWGE